MNKPIRVQRKRIKGWKMPVNTVYVGRPTLFGNPFKLGQLFDSRYPVSREQAVFFYKDWLFRKGFVDSVKSHLKGKDLCCWCPLDAICHADILLEVAND